MNTYLDYHNEEILIRFEKLFEIDRKETTIIFEETKKWLYLANLRHPIHGDKFNVTIYEPILIIDEMWHNFILFTSEYLKYCTSHFDRIIHHSPNIIIGDTNETIVDNDKEIEKMLCFIYDNLGKETFQLWFEEFPKKYSREQINLIRKKI